MLRAVKRHSRICPSAARSSPSRARSTSLRILLIPDRSAFCCESRVRKSARRARRQAVERLCSGVGRILPNKRSEETARAVSSHFAGVQKHLPCLPVVERNDRSIFRREQRQTPTSRNCFFLRFLSVCVSLFAAVLEDLEHDDAREDREADQVGHGAGDHQRQTANDGQHAQRPL